MWESRRDFQVLWAEVFSVHQDGISIGRGRGFRGRGRVAFAVGQVNGCAVLRYAPALRVTLPACCGSECAYGRQVLSRPS